MSAINGDPPVMPSSYFISDPSCLESSPPTEHSLTLADHSLPSPEDIRIAAALCVDDIDKKIVANRRRRLHLSFLTLIVIVTIIAVSIGLSGNGNSSLAASNSPMSNTGTNSSNGNTQPDVAPSNEDDEDGDDASVDSMSRVNEVKNFLSFYTRMDVLDDPSSPQYQALLWISEGDPLDVDLPTNTHYSHAFQFVQRYVLATLYYATGGDSWKNKKHLKWLSQHDVCEWNYLRSLSSTEVDEEWTMGIQCSMDGDIIYISLRTSYERLKALFLLLHVLLLTFLKMFVSFHFRISWNQLGRHSSRRVRVASILRAFFSV
jgi:hypothetical protein